MLGVAVAIIRDQDIARDIVHDVFTTLLLDKVSLLPSKAYLLQATRNRCLNHIRNMEIRQRISNLYILECNEYDADECFDAKTMEEIKVIIDTLLSPRQAEIMEMRYSKGMKFSEIAETLGISESAVYRHAGNALEVLRNKLKDNG